MLLGGAGDDVLLGGDGDDVLLGGGGLGVDLLRGGEGDDLANGGDGNDTALLGAGDDKFVWNPGDDNDTLEGQDGYDTMLFNGANVAENIDVAANGGRVRFFRDIANVVMDLDDVEGIDYNALGGADNIVVNDLSGTDVVEVNTNLAGAGGAGDAAADNVIAHGTNGDDVAIVAGDASGTTVFGLAARVNLTGVEAASDRVTVRTLAGDDVVDASELPAIAGKLTLDGGNDDDILLGGEGDDILLGGEGDDVLLGGGGLDTIDGGPGENVVIQGLVADPVTSATVVGKEWLTTHGSTDGGKTVLEIDGKKRKLPRADLSKLIRDARSV